MDALVTGASGFVGSHLAKHLRETGSEVRGYVRRGSPRAARLDELQVERIEGDLADLATLRRAARGVRTIFHVGAAMNGSWEQQEATTVRATRELADAVLQGEAERLVFVSSLTVYEAAGERIDEVSPYKARPREMGPYAWSKIEAEQRLFELHRERGLAMSVVRPGIVVGPHGPLLFPHLGLRRGNTIFTFGDGGNRLPLTYVDNTVAGIRLAGERDAALGEAFNLVDDGALTVGDYLARYREATGERLRIVRLPFALPLAAAAAYELAAALRIAGPGGTTRRRMRAKHHSILFDNAKAKRTLGWSMGVPLDEGLARTFRWYRERRANR